MHILFIVATIYTIYAMIREATAKEITKEDLENKDLYELDRLNRVPVEERLELVKKGRYKNDNNNECHRPHRDKNGKIVIENTLLWEEDLKKYNSMEVQKFILQGKYNLTQDELEKEKERIDKKLEKLYDLL